MCIQESNLNSSSSFQIPGFSALCFDRTHSRSGILPPVATHASGIVVIFVRQGLSFSKLSTSSLSSLDPYSDYVGINISLNNSSSLSFLNVYTPLLAVPRRMAEPTPFLPPFFPPPEISSVWETSTFLSPFRIGLTNPGRALGQSSLLSISLKLLTLSGIPPFSTNSFRLASILALLAGLDLFFLIGALVWFFKITKVVPFESVEVFHKDPFLALFFSLSSSIIFRPLCLLPSAALFTLTI